MSLGHTFVEKDLESNEKFLSCFKETKCEILSIDVSLTTFCDQNDNGEESFKFSVWCYPVRKKLGGGKEELITGDCCQCLFDNMFDMMEFGIKVTNRIKECNMLGKIKKENTLSKNHKRIFRLSY